jgi:hypothetical protein
MRAINHALLGSVIGLSVGNPWIAVPVAVASHFALDMVPHHDFSKNSLNRPIFLNVAIADTIACAILVMLLAYWQPTHWPLAALCAFLAVSPDFMWIPRYMRFRRNEPAKDQKGIVAFHHHIQWFQRPIGGFVEIAWFFSFAYVLYYFIHYR